MCAVFCYCLLICNPIYIYMCVYVACLFYVCCSDCVGVGGNDCCVSGVVEDSVLALEC